MLTVVIPLVDMKRVQEQGATWRPYAHDTPERPWVEVRVEATDEGERPTATLRLQVTTKGGALQEHAVWWDTTAPGGNPFLGL